MAIVLNLTQFNRSIEGQREGEGDPGADSRSRLLQRRPALRVGPVLPYPPYVQTEAAGHCQVQVAHRWDRRGAASAVVAATVAHD